MRSDVQKKISGMLKKRNLPSRPVIAKLSKSKIDKMSYVELEELLKGVKGKLMLLRAKLRGLKGDTKKRLANLKRSRAKLETEKRNLGFGNLSKSKKKNSYKDW